MAEEDTGVLESWVDEEAMLSVAPDSLSHNLAKAESEEINIKANLQHLLKRCSYQLGRGLTTDDIALL